MKESCANGERTICFRRATFHTCIFRIACVDACECHRTPLPSRPECLNVNKKLPF